MSAPKPFIKACLDCGSVELKARGLCRPHYARRKRQGTLPPLPTVKERLLANVHYDPSGCWLWTGALGSEGYSTVTVNRRQVGGHRLSYETFVGPIPEGLVIDHHCRNRHCINPEHLEPVTQRVNALRGVRSITAINEAKTHCHRGHPFTPENTYLAPSGTRHCRTCTRAAKRRHDSTPEGKAKAAARARRKYARRRAAQLGAVV